MIVVIALLALVLVIYGPHIWVRYVIHKYNDHVEAMPGTGAELAAHLIERFELHGVTVKEVGPDENYYSPGEKMVGLSPEVYSGKSLSAVAIATHEVGHAIQYTRKEPISQLREKYSFRANLVQNIGIYILASAPLIGAFSRNPAIIVFLLAVGVISMLASVACHALVLPEEFDASFGKALPILSEGYVPEEQLPAIRQVLKACALTYVAGALSDMLSIWRWLAIIR